MILEATTLQVICTASRQQSSCSTIRVPPEILQWPRSMYLCLHLPPTATSHIIATFDYITPFPPARPPFQ